MKIQSVNIYKDTETAQWGLLFLCRMKVEGYSISVDVKGDTIFPDEADAARAAGRVWIAVGGDLGGRIDLLTGLYGKIGDPIPAGEMLCGTPEIMEAQGIATCDLCGRSDPHEHLQEEYGRWEGNPLDPDTMPVGDEHLEEAYEDKQSGVDHE